MLTVEAILVHFLHIYILASCLIAKIVIKYTKCPAKMSSNGEEKYKTILPQWIKWSQTIYFTTVNGLSLTKNILHHSEWVKSYLKYTSPQWMGKI